MKRISAVLISLLLVTALLTMVGCSKPEVHDPNLDVLDFTLVAEDAAALEQLEVYTNLQTLDLRGSDCYEAIENYIASHPQVKVTYDVEVAGNRYEPTVESLKLEDGSFDLTELLAVMKHLPKLVSLELPKTSLTADQIQNIAETYPNLDVAYTIELLGQEVTSDLTELDLSGLTPADLDEALLDKLRLLPGLTNVQLMTEAGTSNFAPVDVKALMDVLPGAAMNYSFQLFGQTVTTADERVEFKAADIYNEGVPEIRAALDILPNCTYFLLDNCGIDDEILAQLRDDYPNTKIVWRVFWSSKHHVLTDTEMINANNVSTEPTQVLKYCTDVKYLDLGHSPNLHNIEFVRYMPNLVILIISDSKVTDLTPLMNCPNLEMIEIVKVYTMVDVSPLAHCTKLKGINMSGVRKITDITSLYGLQDMKRLYIGGTGVSEEMYKEACEAMPNCWISNTLYHSSGVWMNYAVGWRLDKGGTWSQWYLDMREIFGYKDYYYSGKEKRMTRK